MSKKHDQSTTLPAKWGASNQWWDQPNPVYGKSEYKASCYATHPVIEIGGGTLVGGNCGHPVCKDASVYIGLDTYSYAPRSSGGFPWAPKKIQDGIVADFLYPITDMQPPKDVKNFVMMIDYIIERLALHEKVHVGCVGGHGRTGVVIAAVVAVLHPEIESAIAHVRSIYCTKAVESADQVAFLMKHFKVKKETGAKSHTAPNLTKYRSISDYTGTVPTAPMFDRNEMEVTAHPKMELGDRPPISSYRSAGPKGGAKPGKTSATVAHEPLHFSSIFNLTNAND